MSSKRMEKDNIRVSLPDQAGGRILRQKKDLIVFGLGYPGPARGEAMATRNENPEL